MAGFVRYFTGKRPPSFVKTNAPIITTSILEVNEDVLEVGALEATDPNGLDVTFSIYSGIDATKFEIVDNVLYFKNAPNFEEPGSANGTNTYYLMVKAINTAKRSSTKMIRVNVLNSNETPNTISLDNTNIDEEEVIGTIIGGLTTTLEGDITYTLVSRYDAAFFSIDGNNLLSNEVFSYETRSIYNVTIQASNGVDEPISKTFTITVNNIDEAPVSLLISKNYINEENAIGDTIATISCIDPENNETQTYSLVAGVGDTDNASFTVTGNLLKAAEVYDFETKNTYSIRVKVTTDTGELESQFTINITNVNEAPVFTSSTTFSIQENNTSVGTITATDPEDQIITYSIVAGVDKDFLSINSSTGVLSYRIAPNYDSPQDLDGNNIYEITVRAEDSDGLYTDQNISITVLDTAEGELYVDYTNGNDNWIGSSLYPVKTIVKAVAMSMPGDIIYLRDGIHYLSTNYVINGKNGTVGKPITIMSYPSENASIQPIAGYFGTVDNNAGKPTTGFYMRGQYWNLKNLEITGFAQQSWLGGNLVAGLWCTNVSNCNFEGLKIHHNGMGMLMKDDSSNNTILNCDFYSNTDPYTNTPGSGAYGNADGLQIAFTTGTAASTGINWIIGCRAWLNSDDGFDNYSNDGYVIYEDCWAFKNGYQDWNTQFSSIYANGNGIKLGSSTFTTTVKRSLTRCLAAGNKSKGIETNQGLAGAALKNCSALLNGSIGFHFSDNPVPNLLNYDFTNCLGYGNGTHNAYLDPLSTLTSCNFTYNNGTNPSYSVSAADFVEIADMTELIADRKADGSLPDITFGTLDSGSELINGGTYCGLPYSGTAPSLGCFEYDESSGSNESPNFSSTSEKIVYSGDTIVLTLEANDPELDSIIFSFNSGDDDDVFEIVNNVLRFKTACDFENPTDADEDNVYNVNILATDQNGATAEQEMVIIVLPEPAPLYLKWSTLLDAATWLNGGVVPADTSNLSVLDNWNTKFNLPTEGTVFTSVVVDTPNNTIELWGATNIALQPLLFYQVTTLLEVTDDAYCVKRGKGSVFYQATGLTKLHLPACTEVWEAFCHTCTALNDLVIPKLTLAGMWNNSSGNSAFNGCSSVTTFNFPKLIEFGNYCFRNCSVATGFNFPLATKIGGGSFFGCTSATTYNLSSCTNLGNTVGDEGSNLSVWGNITGKTISVTIASAMQTCNGGSRDGDLDTLATNNTETITYV